MRLALAYLPRSVFSSPVELKPWHCMTCQRGFKRKGDLTRHEILHTGTRPFKCGHPGCGKRFSQNSGLRTHMNIHTGAKPYVCKIAGCTVAFSDPSSCARHQKETHRRVHPFRCPFERCKASIKRRSAFAQHLSIKHGINPKDVDIDQLAPPLLPMNLVPTERSRKRSDRQKALVETVPNPRATGEYSPLPVIHEHKPSHFEGNVGEGEVIAPSATAESDFSHVHQPHLYEVSSPLGDQHYHSVWDTSEMQWSLEQPSTSQILPSYVDEAYYAEDDYTPPVTPSNRYAMDLPELTSALTSPTESFTFATPQSSPTRATMRPYEEKISGRSFSFNQFQVAPYGDSGHSQPEQAQFNLHGSSEQGFVLDPSLTGGYPLSSTWESDGR